MVWLYAWFMHMYIGTYVYACMCIHKRRKEGLVGQPVP